MRQIDMSVLAWIGVGVLFVTAGSSRADAAEFHVRYLARKARITANSEYSQRYVAKFVADGQIPAAGNKKDVGRAWCVKGNTHRNRAELVSEWSQPVSIAAVVYYG